MRVALVSRSDCSLVSKPKVGLEPAADGALQGELNCVGCGLALDDASFKLRRTGLRRRLWKWLIGGDGHRADLLARNLERRKRSRTDG